MNPFTIHHRPLLATPLLLLSAVLASGCGGEDPAVASVEVSPSTVRLAYPTVQPIRLAWAPSAALEAEPLVFVHLLDEEGAVLRTFDHPFPRRWRPGEPVEYEVKLYQSALAPPLPPGRYRLTLGLYEAGGERWPLAGLGEPVARREYPAAEVEVPAEPAGPALSFSPSWLAVEPGADRQVLARRWVNGRGAIGLSGLNELAGPGAVWMVVRIPPADAANEDLVFEGGASAQSVLVRSECGGSETGISGPGAHELILPVEQVPPDGACRIVLLPNFHLAPRGPGSNRSVVLENLGWVPSRPAAPARAAAAP
jgi:hypothetical protein